MGERKREVEITFIDLFAGIGGFHLAIQKIIPNSKCVFASEIDKKCIEVYRKNFNHSDEIPDITKINSQGIPEHDFLLAGFPCQPFSNAGLKNGFNDIREREREREREQNRRKGGLFLRIINILQEKKPKFFLLENVKHLIRHDRGKTWQFIQAQIKKVGYITTQEPLLVNPIRWGIPQNRERVYIAGVHADLTSEPYLNIELPNPKPLKKFSSILDKEIDPQYFMTQDKVLTALKAWDTFVKNVKRPKGRTLPVIWVDDLTKKHSKKYLATLKKWEQDYLTDMEELYQNNKEFIDKWVKEYQPQNWAIREKRLEWQAGKKYSSFKEVFIQLRQSGIRCKKSTTFPTLVAMVNTSFFWDEKLGQFRYLTPREVARLQSFPENFILAENDKDAYKQFGNAINLECAKQVIREIWEKYGKTKISEVVPHYQPINPADRPTASLFTKSR